MNQKTRFSPVILRRLMTAPFRRAGLRLLEEHEQKLKALRQALIEGKKAVMRENWVWKQSDGESGAVLG